MGRCLLLVYIMSRLVLTQRGLEACMQASASLSVVVVINRYVVHIDII